MGKLLDACLKGNTQDAEAALAAENDAKGITPLMHAVNNGFTDVVKALLSVNQQCKSGWTALMCACHRNYPHLVRVLLDAGADVNLAKHDGHTALGIACQYSTADVVKMLLDAGADPNVRATSGDTTPLILACNYAGPAVVKMLVDAGADVDARSNNITPLVAAARYNPWPTRLAVIKVLVHAGADVNAMHEWSPLHVACDYGCADLVRVLLEAGADTEAFGPRKKTPMRLAIENGFQIIQKMLIDAAWQPGVF